MPTSTFVLAVLAVLHIYYYSMVFQTRSGHVKQSKNGLVWVESVNRRKSSPWIRCAVIFCNIGALGGSAHTQRAPFVQAVTCYLMDRAR